MKKITQATLLIVTILLGTVVYSQHVNADLETDYYHDADSFADTVKHSNNPGYFDPANKDQFYTKIPKGKHYISIKKVIGGASSLTALPTYPFFSGGVHYVSSIKDVDGKYRMYIPGYKKYISSNKKNVKFITEGQAANTSWGTNPDANGYAKSKMIPVPTVIGQALDAKAYGKPPYSKSRQKKAELQLKKNSTILGKYFLNKTIYDRQYYIKRYKYYDKLFGLHGDYSLKNWQSYTPEQFRHASKKM